MTQTNINTNDCWLFAGSLNKDGYGHIGSNYLSKTYYYYTHRLSYESVNGLIPKGLVIDHLCGVRQCLNPVHMETVTPKVNARRGQHTNSWNSAKTHCPKGHEYSVNNTMINKRGGRLCRMCKRLARLH